MEGRKAAGRSSSVAAKVEAKGAGHERMSLRCGVVTLFPEMVRDALAVGVVSRAIGSGLVELTFENPRDHAPDRHRRVDDRPFGGGPGMVMTPGPLVRATRALAGRMGASAEGGRDGVHVVYVSPQGRRFDQALARDWAGRSGLLFIAGRYEGIDERVIEAVVDEEVSLGDFVLSGGEYAAIAMIDAVARLLPGALGCASSAHEDSFGESGLLDWPHYTRPESFEGRDVPAALLSGDHARIAHWRRTRAEERTRVRRPDLLDEQGGAPGRTATSGDRQLDTQHDRQGQ